MAFLKPDRNILGNPVTIDGDHSPISMSFDFLIVKYK